MEINLKNIEELIFFDQKIHGLFPEFRHLFDQWQLGQRIPGMKTLGQRSVLELLNSIDQSKIAKLEEYFGDSVLLQKIDSNLVSHYEWNIDEKDNLCEYSGYRDFCLSRDADKIKISFWR